MGRFALALFLIIFLVALSSVPCRAEDDVRGPFVSREWGFSMDYPRDLFEERLVADQPGLALVLSGSGGFPTFTVTLARGEYQPSSSKSHADRVLREYHEAGFRDARVVRISRYVHRGVPLRAPLVTLLFMRSQLVEGRGCQDHGASGGGQHAGCVGESETIQRIVRSKVLFISTPSHHYVLTFLDDAEKSDPHVARMLFDNFVVIPPKVGVPERVDDRDDGWPEEEHRNSERLSRMFTNPLARLWGALSPTFFSILDSPGERPAELESFEQTESNESPVERRHSRSWSPPSSPTNSFWRDDKGRGEDNQSDFFLHQLAKIVLPTSSGGQLMSMLMLFASGVIVNRWRRR